VAENFQQGSRALSIIRAVSEVLSSSLEPQQIIDLTLDKLSEFLGVDCCWIQLLHKDSDELVLTAHRGFTPEMAEEIGSMQAGDSFIGQIAVSGQPIVIPQLSADPRYSLVSPTKAGLHSFAAVPLRSGDKVLGVMGVASRTECHFTIQKVELLTAIASQIGMAIDKASLYQQSKQREEQLDLVNRLTRIISSSLDIDEVYEGFAEELRRVMDVDWASVVLIKGKELRFYAMSSKIRSAWEPGQSIPLEGTATAWVATTKEALVEPDLAQERKFWTGEYHLKQGIRSIVYLPLLAKGEAFGALLIGSTRPNAYKERELALLEHISGQIAMPIQNAILFEESEQRRELLAAISRLTRVISSDVDLKGVFQTFARELRALVDFDRLSIGSIEGDRVRFMAVSSEVKTELKRGSTYPLSGSATGWVAEHRETLIEADLARERLFPIDETKLKEGLRSSIHVPLFSKGKVFGTLNLSSTRPNAFGEREREILEQLAAQIAGAIENTRLYEHIQGEARTDGLTGLFNRHYFNERLEEEIRRHSRYGGSFSVVVLDLDSFKLYNEIHGHLAGDALLKEVGAVIRSSVREADLAFRYGGDEFVLLLPEADANNAYSVAERVRQRLAARMARRRISVTASLGLAVWPLHGITGDEIVKAADAAVFQAKDSGGNRVCLSSEIASLLSNLPMPETEANRIILRAVYALAAAVEAKDPYIYGHSRLVNKYAFLLAEAIGLPREKLTHLSTAALLHDIGKIGIPDKILNKAGELTDSEWEQMKQHPRISVSIIEHVPNLLPCQSAILHHHERWDGTGYPSGLKAEEIPLEARILAIADAFAAMTSPRSYRHTLSHGQAMAEMRQGAGSQFDPQLVEIFITAIRKLPLEEKEAERA